MALSAALMDTPVSYEQLEDIEDDFEDVELEILRQQDKLSKDLYAKREKLVSQIPHFWALVFEQSPPDIDEYITPSDSALLLTSLKSLSVERFELPDGDPRSLSFKFTFEENDNFEDTVLEKKFWWRRSQDGWAGLVSEPVKINWKKDMDLTSGLLDLACKVWDEEKSGKTEETEAKKALKNQIENVGIGGISFFAWFGFRGRAITAEEDKAAYQKEQEKRKARKEGKETSNDDMDEDEDDDDEYELEIFPTADDIAVTIAEDLWPSAIRYFTIAQELDGMSDEDFESDAEMGDGDDDDDEDDEAAGGDHPSKKRKA